MTHILENWWNSVTSVPSPSSFPTTILRLGLREASRRPRHVIYSEFLEWHIHQLPPDGHFSSELFSFPGQIYYLCRESAQLYPVNIKVVITKMDKTYPDTFAQVWGGNVSSHRVSNLHSGQKHERLICPRRKSPGCWYICVCSIDRIQLEGLRVEYSSPTFQVGPY